MKRYISSIIIAGSILSIASCTKKENTPAPPAAPTAQVKFMNGYLGTTSVAIAVNSSIMAGDSSLQFMKYTGYQSVTASSSAHIAFESSLFSNIVDSTVNLTANTNYSVFIAGQLTTPAFLITMDDLTAPASGYAKVRFVNLSPDSLNESVLIDTATIASSAKYKTITAFTQVAAGTHKITAVDPANLSSSITISGQTFASGKIYTIVLTGSASIATGAAALTVSQVANN